jgi:hypothetical protein
MALAVTAMLGLGGAERSAQHARSTGLALTAVDPQYIDVISLMPEPGTRLAEAIHGGQFVMPDAAGLLQELRVMVSETHVTEASFHTNHAPDYLDVAGALPEHKARILSTLDAVLSRGVLPPLQPENLRGLSRSGALDGGYECVRGWRLLKESFEDLGKRFEPREEQMRAAPVCIDQARGARLRHGVVLAVGPPVIRFRCVVQARSEGAVVQPKPALVGLDARGPAGRRQKAVVHPKVDAASPARPRSLQADDVYPLVLDAKEDSVAGLEALRVEQG